MPPPWSSRILPDDGEAEAGALLARRHIGLEQPAAVLRRQAHAVVDHVDDDRRRPRASRRRGCGRVPRSSGGTAAIASAAFLMMLVSACEISRRSKRAGIGSSRQLELDVDVGVADAHAGTPPRAPCRRRPRPAITGFGMRAKRENSSTMRPMSSTWRTIVSVHWSKTARILGDRPCRIAAQALGRELDRRQRVLDLVRDAARDVGPGGGALRRDQVGDVVERDDIAVLGVGATARVVTCTERLRSRPPRLNVDLPLRQPLAARAAAVSSSSAELRHDLVERLAEQRRPRCGRSASRPSG